MDGADLSGSDLSAADFSGATLAEAKNANRQGIEWSHIGNIKNSNIGGAKNAPEGFIAWALKNGAEQYRPL